MEDDNKCVYEIAQDFYGEDNVDFIESDDGHAKIIIKWDKVTITNENNNKHTIYDLFGKIDLENGLFRRVRFKRSTFSNIEFSNSYIHSHITRISDLNHYKVTDWHDCCFGRGPIRRTIATLTTYMDLDRWRLFFFELDKFTKVESLQGGPYIRMTSLTSTKGKLISLAPTIKCERSLNNPFWKNFIKMLILEDTFNFNFNGLLYNINEPYDTLLMKISKKFLKYCTNTLTKGQLRMCINECMIFAKYDGLHLYKTADVKTLNDTIVLYFKREPVYLKVFGLNNKLMVLNPNIFEYILYTILNFINAEYGE